MAVQPCPRSSKDHINIRILQTMVSGIPVASGQLKCRILMLMKPFRPLLPTPVSDVDGASELQERRN